MSNSVLITLIICISLIIISALGTIDNIIKNKNKEEED